MTIPLIPDGIHPLAKLIVRQVLEGLFLGPSVPSFPVAMRVAQKVVLDSTSDEEIAWQAMMSTAYALTRIGDHAQTVHDVAIRSGQVTIHVDDSKYEQIPSRR